MSAQQPDLPIIYPTVPGKVAGIVCMDPFTIQCQECGVTDTAETVGLPETGRTNRAIVVVLSRIRFHSRPWSDGRTDNPRLCERCRLARGCDCIQCREDRRTA